MKTGRILLMLLFVVMARWNAFGVGDSYAISALGHEGSDYIFSDTRINTLYKDSDGFIWIGTGATVERIDGYRASCYQFNSPVQTRMPSPYLVNALVENRKHEFWAGTVQGLWRVNHATRQLDRAFADQISCPVYALAHDDSLRLYVGTSEGLFVYDGTRLSHPFRVAQAGDSLSRAVRALAVCNSHEVYLLTADGVTLYDVEAGRFDRYPNTLPGCGAFRCLYRREQMLYIGTESGQVVRFDLLRHTFSPFWTGNHFPVSALEGEDDRLGVATLGGGLVVLQLPHGEVTYTADYASCSEQGFLSDKLSCILFDRDNIWCGTDYYTGLNRLRRRGYLLKRYMGGGFDTRTMLVRAFLRTGGYTLIGTREGFYCVDERTNRTRYVHSESNNGPGLRSNLIFSFYPYGEEVLIGTCAGGLTLFNPRTGTFREVPLTRACRDNDIFMFLEEPEAGLLWLATSDGLYSYDRRTHDIQKYDSMRSGMPGNIVYCAYIDKQQRFWVGTDKGAALFDRRTGRCTTEGLPEPCRRDPVRIISQGRDGRLVFNMLGDYLLTMNQDLDSCRVFSQFTIYNIVQDDAGHYWAGANIGLVRFDESLTHYVLYPSLQRLAASAGPTITKDSDGRFWICALDGLYIVNPEAHFYSPPVRVTSVRVNGRLLADYNTLHLDSTFTLSAGGNTVDFTFFLLDYNGTNRGRYQYRLDGADTAWVSINDRREVTYYGLPPGHYSFRVRALFNPDTEDVTRFDIHPRYPFAAHLWWGIPLFLLVCAAGGTVIRRRRRARALAVSSVSEGSQLLPETPLSAVTAESPLADDAAVAEAARADGQSPSESRRVSAAQAEQVIANLQTYMDREQPYLRSDLKQAEVAVAIGVPTYELSAVFTHYLKMGYYDFVNRYRVAHFCKAVEAGEHKRYSLMGLAERCGFTSKPSFFRAFKKFMGITPSAYIHQHDEAPSGDRPAQA